MKRLLCLLALCAGTLHAQLITLSDFSNFTPDYFSQPFPADSTSWSELTSQAGPTSFSIGDFGSGAAGGAIGNGFIEFLAAETDWSAFTGVTLQGTASLLNQTPTLFFYVESVMTIDGADEVVTALTPFDLSQFDVIGLLSVAAPLNLEGIDPTRVTAWGFVVQEFENPAFAFTFDNVALTAAIPEPSTYALMAGAVTLAGAVVRRMRANRRSRI